MARVEVTASVMTCVRNGYSSNPPLPIQIGGPGSSGDYNNSVYMTFPSFGLPAGSIISGATLTFTMTGYDWSNAVKMYVQACASPGTAGNQVGCTGAADNTDVAKSVLVSTFSATNTARQMVAAGTYYLKMFCDNGNNRKTFSSTAAKLIVDYTAPTPPTPPTGLYISPGVFEGDPTLNWLPGSDGTNNRITGYYVQYRINGGAWQYAGTKTGTSCTLSTSGVGRGDSVTFQVAALSAYATPVWSAAVSGAATKNRLPGKPTEASMSKQFYAPGENARINFTNTGDPDNNLQRVEAEILDRGMTPVTSSSNASYVELPTTGLTPGVSYSFHVRGVDALGIPGDWSDAVSAMVGLPMFVQPKADGVFKRVVSMQVYVPGVGFKTVKSMKIASTQGAINKTVF